MRYYSRTAPSNLKNRKNLYLSLFILESRFICSAKSILSAEFAQKAKKKKGREMTHSTFAYPYFGAFMLFVITFGAFGVTLWIQRILSNKIASKSREKLKVSSYECGVIPNRQQNRISTHYYLIALLFILFDVEIIFMFPWAVNFKALGLFGFVEMILFIALLAIGFIYAWRKGALLWQSLK